MMHGLIHVILVELWMMKLMAQEHLVHQVQQKDHMMKLVQVAKGLLNKKLNSLHNIKAIKMVTLGFQIAHQLET